MNSVLGSARPSHTYVCRNSGCQGDRNFEDAPPEWYQEKGISTPTNCKPCRAWLAVQVDEDVSCNACAHSWRIPQGVKIMHHRNEGVWQRPSYCNRCLDDPDWRRRAEARIRQRQIRVDQAPYVVQRTAGADARTLIQRLEEELQAKGVVATRATKLAIASDLGSYKSARSRRADGLTESRLEHIFSLEEDGGHFGSLSIAAGVQSVDDVVDYLSILAYNDNPNEVFEFASTSPPNTVVKVDRRTGVFVAIDLASHTIGGAQVMMPRTAFRPDRDDGLSKEVRRGRWIPT